MCELLSDELPMLAYLPRYTRSLFPNHIADLKDEAWEVGQDPPPALLVAATHTHSQSNDQLNPQLSFAFVYKAGSSYTSLCFSESACRKYGCSKQSPCSQKSVSIFLSIR